MPDITEALVRRVGERVKGLSFHADPPALQAGKVLQKVRLAVKLILRPRELSSDGGLVLQFEQDQRE